MDLDRELYDKISQGQRSTIFILGRNTSDVLVQFLIAFIEMHFCRSVDRNGRAQDA